MSAARPGPRALLFAAALGLLGWRAFSPGLEAPRPYEPGAPDAGQAWLKLTASAAELTSTFGGGPEGKYGGGDLASYLAAGETLLAQGAFEHGYAHLWPPGMPVVIAAVLALAGPGAYGAKLVAVAVLAWALVLTAASLLIRPLRSRAGSLALLAAPLLLPGFGAFAFGFGAVMSESLSTALFAASLAALLAALGSERARDFALAGLFLGLATLFRAYFEYVGTAVFGIAAVALGLARTAAVLRGGGGARGVRTRARDELARRTPGARALARWLAAYLAFAGVVLPWRLYKLERWGDARLVSTTPGYAFAWGWTPDDRVPSFLHAANTPCKTDPELCAVVERTRAELAPERAQRLALATFAARPGRWLGHKLGDLDWLWFGRPWAELRAGAPWLLLEGLALAAAGSLGAALVFGAAWRRGTAAWLGLAWTTAAFAGWNTVFFALFYHEWRYSMPARAFAALLPVLYLGLRRRDAAARRTGGALDEDRGARGAARG